MKNTYRRIEYPAQLPHKNVQSQSADQDSTKSQPRHQETRTQTINIQASEPKSRGEWFRTRLLGLLANPNGTGRPGSPYWMLRQGIGGKVKSDEFRARVEELLQAGDIVEFWEISTREQKPHRLVLVEDFDNVDRATLADVRARRDILTEFRLAK